MKTGMTGPPRSTARASAGLSASRRSCRNQSKMGFMRGLGLSKGRKRISPELQRPDDAVISSGVQYREHFFLKRFANLTVYVTMRRRSSRSNNKTRKGETMKKIVALMSLMAFVCSASAHCGNCEAGDSDSKPKTECKCGKDCKGADCKCGCHKQEKK